MNKQLDNGDYERKVALRRGIVRQIAPPLVVCETHGGYGVMAAACYPCGAGVVFDIDRRKAQALATQRPTWRVYRADAGDALAAGVASDVAFSLLDVDAYGDPWPALESFFCRPRGMATTLHVVVTDGMRLKAKRGGLWRVASARAVVRRYGNAPLDNYLASCRERLAALAAEAGMAIAGFGGYYCGHAQQMTHYTAVMQRSAPALGA